jgi:hypothetical protein
MAPKTNIEKVEDNDVDPKSTLWCPFCNDWSMQDKSMTARKRLGQHIADKHNEKVAFPNGEEPPELIED